MNTSNLIITIFPQKCQPGEESHIRRGQHICIEHWITPTETKGDQTLSMFELSLTLPQIISAIFSIMVMDLLLSGDNAAVIGMAICRLPHRLRRRAALCGTGAAILLRLLFTIFATLLLAIPYFQAAGGLVLLFITFKLLKNGVGEDTAASPEQGGKTSFWGAVGMIVVADLSMAFDNVLAVAGAAHGHPLLVAFGLLFSIPILVGCSTLLATLMNKHPFILWIGAALLLHTALNMILGDAALPLAGLVGVKGHYFSLGAAALLLLWGFRSCAAAK